MSLYHSKGFSLVELVIVIAIIGIVAALAAPPMMKLVQQYQVNSEARALVSALQESRAKAILEKRNRLDSEWAANRENIVFFGNDSKATLKFTHNFMGRVSNLDPAVNGGCIRLVHKQNIEIETSILAEERGSVQVFRNKKECKE